MTALDDELAIWFARLSFDPARGLQLGPDEPWRTIDVAYEVLTERLYAAFFGGHAPSREGQYARRDPHVSGDTEFVARLTHAAAGAVSWDRGWEVRAVEGSGVWISNARLSVFVADRAALSNPAAVNGEDVRVRMPSARPGLSPGFFVFTGRAGRSASPLHVRAYLNVSPEGAVSLIQTFARDPRAESLLFDLKVVNDPKLYARHDTAVLYVDQASATQMANLLVALHAERPEWFRSETPPMTEPIAPGIALAEGMPAHLSGESFGSWRSRLVARGMIRAVAEPAPLEQWRQFVAVSFSEAGLLLDSPAFSSLRLVRVNGAVRIEPV